MKLKQDILVLKDWKGVWMLKEKISTPYSELIIASVEVSWVLCELNYKLNLFGKVFGIYFNVLTHSAEARKGAKNKIRQFSFNCLNL